jgi:hypothetical protein
MRGALCIECATSNGQRATNAVRSRRYNGDENERRRTARAVCRGVDRSGAWLKRWMGGGDGFAGMAGVGYRKL